MCPAECIGRIRQALETSVVVENISVSRLTLDMLYDWFDVQQAQQTELCVGFSYVEYHLNGAVSYLQGLFYPRSATIARVRRITGQSGDRYLSALHRERPVVIYA